MSPVPTARRGVSPLAWAAYAVAAVVIALDQLSKWWVLGPLDLPTRGQVRLFPPWLNLTLTHNPGVSFRLLAGGALSRWGLTAFSVIVAVALGAWASRTSKRLQALGIGLIMGGALGNAFDRARLGMVTDFVDVSAALPFFPWIFNVADSAITVGVAVLLLESVLTPTPATTAPEKPA